MKKLNWILGWVVGMGILMSSGGAKAASVQSTEISCLLNKSFSLVIEIEEGDSGQPRVILSEKNFLQEKGEVFARLNRPSIIRYGNVLMISQDYGRSGYAFLRFEKAGEGSLNGWVDINLFTNQSMTEVRGNLAQLLCYGDF